MLHILGLNEVSHRIRRIESHRIRGIPFSTGRALDDPNDLLLSRVDDGADRKREGIMVRIGVLYTSESVVHQVCNQTGDRFIGIAAIDPRICADLGSLRQFECCNPPLEPLVIEQDLLELPAAKIVNSLLHLRHTQDADSHDLCRITLRFVFVRNDVCMYDLV